MLVFFFFYLFTFEEMCHSHSYYLAKARFLEDMLLGMVLFYVIIFLQDFLAQQALHLYNISCVVVYQCHVIILKSRSKVMVILWSMHDGNKTIVFSNFHQINSKLGVKVEDGLSYS
jgi:hypothetical protein